MIVRMWHGRVPTAKAAAYRARALLTGQSAWQCHIQQYPEGGWTQESRLNGHATGCISTGVKVKETEQASRVDYVEVAA